MSRVWENSNTLQVFLKHFVEIYLHGLKESRYGRMMQFRHNLSLSVQVSFHVIFFDGIYVHYLYGNLKRNKIGLVVRLIVVLKHVVEGSWFVKIYNVLVQYSNVPENVVKV